MNYRDFPEQFRQNLLSCTAHDLDDYVFFTADLIESLKYKKKVNIIPHKPYGQAFAGTVEDAEYQFINEDTEIIILKFKEREDFKFYLNRKSIKQPSPYRYHVNHANFNQELNFTFIKV